MDSFTNKPMEKNKQQTVVTFLINELLQNRLLALRYDADNTFNEIIQKADKLFQEQIIKAANDADKTDFWTKYGSFEDYYNKNYNK